MSSAKSGVSLPSNEKRGLNTKDGEATNERRSVNVIQKGKQNMKTTSSLSEMYEENASSSGSKKKTSHDRKPSSIDNFVSNDTNTNIKTGGGNAIVTNSKTIMGGTAVSKGKSNVLKPVTTVPKATDPVKTESTDPVVSKNSSDPKTNLKVNQSKKEKNEDFGTRPIVTSAAAIMGTKQSQQHPHSKPQKQQQHRYFVPSRQNQEEAVFKMVQNIFKLLETRGPLTMAQLEYNLPILIVGSSPSVPISPQAISATASKTDLAVSRDPKVSEGSSDASNVEKKQVMVSKTSSNRTSLCEEKLIPGNMVPDIVELLVTLGLIQQQTNIGEGSSAGATLSLSSSADNDSSGTTQPQEAVSAKNLSRKQFRFAVHFGKPKQFLVTPTNILSEIAKAQTEIQLSRQRQESLKEALNMTDEHAAERVKHIVLQHPQVVDDPVYVTALRNLQVDGMLMAGASGTTSASSLNTPPSSTSRDGSGKLKSGFGGSGKRIGGGKRRQSGNSATRRKRQRFNKDLLAGSGDIDSGSGIKATVPCSSVDVDSKQTVVGSLPTERGKDVSLFRASSVSHGPKSMPPVAAVASASANVLKNT